MIIFYLFGRYGHGFVGCDRVGGLGGFGGFNGLSGFGEFNVLGGFGEFDRLGRFDGFSGLSGDKNIKIKINKTFSKWTNILHGVP